MEHIQELVNERVKLHEANKGLLEAASKDKRTLTAEEQQTFDRQTARMDEINATKSRHEKQAEDERAIKAESERQAESRGRKTASHGGSEVALPTAEELDLAFRAWAAGGQATDAQRAAAEKCGFDVRRSSIDMASVIVTDKDGKAVRMYVPAKANGAQDVVNGAEVRSLATGTTTAGGNAIPNEMMRPYHEALKWYGRVEELADRINTETGAPLPVPTFTDTANSGRVLAEETAATTTTDPTVNTVSLSSFKLSSDMVLVSWELLQDALANLPEYLGRALGTRLGRIRNTKFTVGAGTTEPKGVVTCSGTGVTAAATNAFTLDEVLDLVHSLDPAYRNLPGTGFMAHDTIIKYLRKFKDSTGRYMWEPSLVVGQPDRVFGYPLTPNNDMDSALTTGKKLLLFGNLKLGFIVRDAGATRFQRLEELFARTHQVAFEAIQRSDSNTPDATALKLLVLA